MKTLPLFWLAVIIIAAIWDGVWKLIALWKSARNNELAWYVCLAIFNTVGILPILYILFFQKTEQAESRRALVARRNSNDERRADLRLEKNRQKPVAAIPHLPVPARTSIMDSLSHRRCAGE